VFLVGWVVVGVGVWWVGVVVVDARLKLGDLIAGAVDRVLDRSNLGRDLESRIFDDLLAHGCSFSGSVSPK
jgi:hypothetical protein